MGGWSLFSFDLELFVQVRQAEEEGFLAEVPQFALLDLEDLWNFHQGPVVVVVSIFQVLFEPFYADLSILCQYIFLLFHQGPVVVVVCGGNLVSTAMVIPFWKLSLSFFCFVFLTLRQHFVLSKVESWRADSVFKPYIDKGSIEEPKYYRWSSFPVQLSFDRERNQSATDNQMTIGTYQFQSTAYEMYQSYSYLVLQIVSVQSFRKILACYAKKHCHIEFREQFLSKKLPTYRKEPRWNTWMSESSAFLSLGSHPVERNFLSYCPNCPSHAF